MRVLVTGATGFVGSAVVTELTGAGHDVVGLARSDRSAAALEAVGAEVLRGFLDDTAGLRAGAAAVDGVIHLAFTHDFSAYDEAARADARAVEALGAGLEGTGRPLVVTAGALGLPTHRVATERDAPVSVARVSEQTALPLADRGVRASVIRLAPTVHGAGDHGFVPTLVDIARTTGVSGYLGAGGRWPAVHRSDAARLFRLALEGAPAGSVLHGVAEEGVPTRTIAETIGRHLQLPVTSIAPEQAGEHFGWLAGFFGVDARVSSTLTQQLLGWQPREIGLLEDLEEGHYFTR